MQQKHSDTIRTSRTGAGVAGLVLTVILAVSLAVAFTAAFYPGDSLALTGADAGGRGIIVQARTYYAVSAGSYQTESQASFAAAAIRAGGGGGYIKNDGEYRILVAVYPYNEQAQSIIVRYPDYSAYGLKSPKVSIDTQPDFKAALSYPLNGMYDQLFDITYKLDKSQISESYARFLADGIIDSLKEYLAQLSSGSNELAPVAAAYNDIANGYGTVMARTGDSMCSRLRYFTLFALDTYIKALEKY